MAHCAITIFFFTSQTLKTLIIKRAQNLRVGKLLSFALSFHFEFQQKLRKKEFKSEQKMCLTYINDKKSQKYIKSHLWITHKRTEEWDPPKKHRITTLDQAWNVFFFYEFPRCGKCGTHQATNAFFLPYQSNEASKHSNKECKHSLKAKGEASTKRKVVEKKVKNYRARVACKMPNNRIEMEREIITNLCAWCWGCAGA